MDAAMRLENVQIFSNGDLGGSEMLGQGADQHAPLAIQHLNDQSTSFFVQHWLTRESLYFTLDRSVKRK
jgi:hypothetical protein